MMKCVSFHNNSSLSHLNVKYSSSSRVPMVSSCSEFIPTKYHGAENNLIFLPIRKKVIGKIGEEGNWNIWRYSVHSFH